MNKLKDGKKRGDTIIGRLEKIKQLEATTSKTMPQPLLTEIELLEEDDEDVKLLDQSKSDALDEKPPKLF
ncbi:hypothetical protein [Agriterribacter sp.]|uniref:hypothetical protein n=1 Tax=Agriterribacter sp. TaxID=2821509 RepID=UPI002CDD8FD0|nr:hypothetical protein [Agriterribacter sp.]HRP57470.1 hypothetical protein [Agriterribacter sp.]